MTTQATPTDATLLASLANSILEATANLEAMRDRIRRAMDRGEYLEENALGQLMLAEGIHSHYRELGINQDGTLRRHDGEDDADMVKHVRRIRRQTLKHLTALPESQWAGLGAVRQFYGREGAKRFLAATEKFD